MDRRPGVVRLALVRALRAPVGCDGGDGGDGGGGWGVSYDTGTGKTATVRRDVNGKVNTHAHLDVIDGKDYGPMTSRPTSAASPMATMADLS